MILFNKVLYGLGAVFSLTEKIRYKALLEYKTKYINRYGSSVKWIGPDTQIRNVQNINIGENTYVNSGMLIAGKNSKIHIGNNCLISFNVHIRTDMHNYKKRSELILDQGHSEKDIIIEDDVWVGYGAQIMPGVVIGKGAVIASGSIVTKDVPEYAVVAGIPGKIISYRD